ncbi:MAG: hypothetical protein WC438_05155 [Candidatus Pacearchaeota archaeon]
MGKFRSYVLKLYSLDTRIFSEENIDADLLSKLKGSNNFPVFFRNMTEIDRYLFVKTIYELEKKENNEIFNQSFPLGYVDPSCLSHTQSLSEYFQILTKDYPRAERVNETFDSAIDLVQTSKDRGSTLIAALKGSYSSERDPRLKLELLNFLAKDFSETGDWISLGRVKLIYPYLGDLMKKPFHKRVDFLRKILDRTYPFTDENKYDTEYNDNWASEIRSAES